MPGIDHCTSKFFRLIILRVQSVLVSAHLELHAFLFRPKERGLFASCSRMGVRLVLIKGITMNQLLKKYGPGAVVTGASSGIGEQYCYLLAQAINRGALNTVLAKTRTYISAY